MKARDSSRQKKECALALQKKLQRAGETRHTAQKCREMLVSEQGAKRVDVTPNGLLHGERNSYLRFSNYSGFRNFHDIPSHQTDQVKRTRKERMRPSTFRAPKNCDTGNTGIGPK